MFKKRLLALLIAIIMVFAVAGCGGEKESNDGAVEVSVLLRGGANTQITKASIDKFNKENEGKIKIKYEEKDDSIGEYLRVSLQAGTAPDVFEGIGESTKTMGLNKNWLRELDEETIKKYTDLLVPGAVRKEANGKVYTVAESTGGTFKLIWNKEMFKDCGLDPENPPKTWDEVVKYAKILTEKGQGVKYGYALPFKNEGFVRIYSMIAGAPSDKYNVDGYDPTKGKFDFSIYKPLINIYKQMVNDKSVFPSPATLDNDTARAQFAEGNIGMLIGARWDVGVFNEQFPCKMDWGIANLPTLDGELTGSYPTATATGGMYMNAKCDHPDEQLKVWEFLHSEEFAMDQQNAGVRISAYKSLAKPEKLTSESKGFVELNMPDENTPLHYLDVPSIPAVQVMGDNYDRAILAMITGQIEVDKGLKDLTDRYNKGIEEWEKKGNNIKDYIIPDYNPNTYIPQ